MTDRLTRRSALLALGAGALASAADSPARTLRVAADPNNLPFSNDRREGFENKVADLLARDLGVGLDYAWRAQRRGFFRMALQEDGCDLFLGVPAGFERALTTAPYYRSTYVFASRRDRHLDIKSLDDPRLRTLKVGVQLVGDDGMNPPPAHALAARGIVANVVGFTVFGDYAEPNPAARIMDALAGGEIDVAVVWGPLAGYAARRGKVALTLAPVEPAVDRGLRMTFAIALGVRKGNRDLRDRLDAALGRNRAAIGAILDDYGVPRVADGATR